MVSPAAFKAGVVPVRVQRPVWRSRVTKVHPDVHHLVLAVSESRPRRRPFRRGASAALKLALYFGACWTVIGILISRSALATVAVIVFAIYTTFPLFVFLRYGGWPFYPGKYF